MKNLLLTPSAELSFKELLDLQLMLITKIKIITNELLIRDKLFYDVADDLYNREKVNSKAYEIVKKNVKKNQELLDFLNNFYK
jgi:hypothetical protein